MSSTRIAVAPPHRSAGRGDAAERIAERIGLVLLAWADHRRTTGPRTIDLDRVQRGTPVGRPFC
jgi:hypothetical protein